MTRSVFPRRYRRVALGFATAAALVMAACGTPPGQENGAEPADDPGAEDPEVEGEEGGLADDPAFVWAVTGADREIHEEVVELWNELNPDNQVEVFFLAPTADEQRQAMFQDLQTQAGEFDVLGLDVIWTGEFADFGYIESLEDLRSEVEPHALEGALDSAAWQGELFALPYVANGALLYYRTDLVDEPPTTWDELVEVGTQVAEEEGIEPYVGQGDQYEGFVVNYLELFWSAGGDLFDEGQEQSTFLEGDAAERALNFMTQAYDDGFYAQGFDSMVEDDARALFQAGDAVFMRNWPYAVPLLEEDDSDVAGNVGIAPLPTFDGEGTVSAMGGLNNAVSVLSENQDLAREFVVWLATAPEVWDILIDNSLPPASATAYEDVQDDPTFELLGEVFEYTYARPPVPGYNSLSLAIQDNLHPAYLGQADAQNALEQVDQAANDALTGE